MAAQNTPASSHQRLFERFDAFFADPRFADSEREVDHYGRNAVARDGIISVDLEVWDGAGITCYRYDSPTDLDPGAPVYEAELTRDEDERRVIAGMAFAELLSYRREDGDLKPLGRKAALQGQFAVRVALLFALPTPGSNLAE